MVAKLNTESCQAHAKLVPSKALFLPSMLLHSILVWRKPACARQAIGPSIPCIIPQTGASGGNTFQKTFLELPVWKRQALPVPLRRGLIGRALTEGAGPTTPEGPATPQNVFRFGHVAQPA